MIKHKEGIASNGELLHYSVGAVIEREGKYLLIDRVKPPLGFAGVAGHVDNGESPEEALIREVMEESGLKIQSFELLFEEEILWNSCGSGHAHYWWLYECNTTRDLFWNEKETKSINWYTKEEIKNLTLEPVWEYWFKKLRII